MSNIFHFHPYLGKISNLTRIFLMGGSTTDHANKKNIGVFPKDLLIWMMFDMHMLDAIRCCKVVFFFPWKNVELFQEEGNWDHQTPYPSLKLTAKAPENGWLEVGR